MNNPLVSIIIPTFNRACFLSVSLNSIVSQTYINWECWVVDDGSTDATSKIMETYCLQDKRINFVCRPDNYPKGANGSRNYGLSLCNGNYVAFCDDDDFWLPKKLEEQMLIFKIHPNIGLVTCNIEYVDGKGTRTGRVILQTGNHGYVFAELLLKNRLSMITPVLKREVFDKVGLFNTDFIIFEDWEMWRRVSYYYNFYALEDVLACVRKHDSNTSLIVTKDPYEQYERYRELNKALLEWGKNRFTKADRKLISKVTIKRYLQILRNHCPGILNKMDLIFRILWNNLKLEFK